MRKSGVDIQAMGVLLAVGAWAGPAGGDTLPVGFYPLGDLSGGTVFSTATSISADGTTVVGYSSTASLDLAGFAWTEAGGMVAFGNGENTVPRGVSGDGQIVTGAVGGGSPRIGDAFAWNRSGPLVPIEQLPDGLYESTGFAVSTDGSTVVGYTEVFRENPVAFRWSEQGGFASLGLIDGTEGTSVARGVSASGEVIVGNSTSSQGMEAFRWTEAEGMVGLGDLAGGNFSGQANAVSEDGSVVVGRSSSARGAGPTRLEAFVWTQESGLQGLGFLDGEAISSAEAVSATDAPWSGVRAAAERPWVLSGRKRRACDRSKRSWPVSGWKARWTAGRASSPAVSVATVWSSPGRGSTRRDRTRRGSRSSPSRRR